MWIWPEHNLRISQDGQGARVDQGNNWYIANGWQLSDAVRSIFEEAFSNGLTCILQRGHPTESRYGSVLDYISFSLSPEDYWVFALNMDSCVPNRPRSNPTQVVFKKIFRHILRANGISCPPEWRTPQNVLVQVTDLQAALRAVKPDVPALGKMTGARLRRGKFSFFVDEEDLHSSLVHNWNACLLSSTLGLTKLASKMLLGGVARREGEIDILSRDKDSNLYVIELKDVAKAGGTESPIQQLDRYMKHKTIVTMARELGGEIRGILIATEIQHDILRQISASALPLSAYEASKAEAGVSLECVCRSNAIGSRSAAGKA